jgi:hypothetical protein
MKLILKTKQLRLDQLRAEEIFTSKIKSVGRTHEKLRLLSIWNHIKTFPKHFREGSQEKVIESRLSNEPQEALGAFLEI